MGIMKFSPLWIFARAAGCVFAFAAAGAFAQAPEEIEIDVSEELESGFIASSEERADHYIRKEEFGKLLAHARKWTKNYPGDSEAWRYLGVALREKDDVAGSADAFDRAWKLSDKKDYRIKEGIGDIYFKIKEWGKAEDAYRTAIALRGDRARLWEKLADSIILARGAGWKVSAAAALKKMLSFAEYVNDRGRWREYADVLDLLEADADELYRAYRHIVRLTVGNIPAWERLYVIETERGNAGEAEKIAGILRRLDPQNPAANLHFGMRDLESNPAAAKKYLSTALESGKLSGRDSARIYVIFGDGEKSRAESLSYYKKAVESDPSNLGAWESAVVRLRSLGRRKKASAAYEGLLSVERKLARGEEIVAEDARVLLE